MPKENEFTKLNPLCLNAEEWTSRDVQSAEDEVGEFLYGLIRLIKPKFIVETGCYLGDSTIQMAKALQKNGVGTIIACDIDDERVKFVDERIQKEGLEKVATVILREGLELIETCGEAIDFAFIDSSPEGKVRKAEIEELLKYLRPMKMFALHDTAPQHQQINKVANEVALPKVYFNTPRGLTLFMKN